MYRKDFTQLSDDERTRLAAGFNHLFTTGLIESNATLHASNFNGGIIHWGPAFLPWHRDFLRKLEIQLQAFDSRITLPYWDWTRGDSKDLEATKWKSFLVGEPILEVNLTPGYIRVVRTMEAISYLQWQILSKN